MNFQVTLFPLFFLSLCTSTISSLNDFFSILELHGKKSCIIWFDKSSPYVNFLIDYYNRDRRAFFEEAFPIDDIFFNNLLFRVISNKKFDRHGLYLDGHRGLIAFNICWYIEITILNILFESYSSSRKFKENISLINILIKFLERYSQIPKQIEKWKQVLKCCLDDSSNITIQYDLLYSLVLWQKNYKDLVIPHVSHDKFVSNCLLFYSNINQIINGKDFKIFEFNHPNRILPIACILDNIDDSGNSLVLSHHEHSFNSFYWKFDFFFLGEKKSDLLLEAIVKKKAQIVKVAEEKVGSETAQPNWVFHLTARFEKYFNINQSQDNQNILFQLKGLTIIEEFLNHSGHKPKRASLSTDPLQIFEKTKENQILNDAYNVVDKGAKNSGINYEDEFVYPNNLGNQNNEKSFGYEFKEFPESETIINETLENQILNTMFCGKDEMDAENRIKDVGSSGFKYVEEGSDDQIENSFNFMSINDYDHPVNRKEDVENPFGQQY
jgi:hypothetical protein